MYKQGQGMLVRFGMLAVALIFAFYTAYTWYFWCSMTFDQDASPALYNMALAFTAVWGLGISAFGIWATIKNPRTSEFMINADAELRKVIWPASQPLFDKRAEAWGATYVVIATMIILTVFIYLVDKFLEWSLQNQILYRIYS